jgi:luciferase family oxidoreductase group 1
MSVPLAILDLAPITPGHSAADSYRASVSIAQTAERVGYRRIWYAEHHNMPTIASSATSVLIAHVAAHTESIRLGAGGIMLPNHAPLTIAEQFGTLATLHPDRIDLGLGRAPGGDRNVLRALRRDPSSSNSFPQDILELQGYLSGDSRVPDVQAVPRAEPEVPLYILGSSLFGAHLAATLGLPYAFASHFAPDALLEAIAVYRREFEPSDQLAEPYVMAGANVIAADSQADAVAQFETARRTRVRSMLARGKGGATPTFSDEQIDAFLTTPEGAGIANMMKYTAAGTGADVSAFLDEFAALTGADELIVAHASLDVDARLRSLEITAEHAMA